MKKMVSFKQFMTVLQTALVIISLASCATQEGDLATQNGQMSLPLSGTANDGTVYRLVDATFAITGASGTVTISSNDYLGQTTAYVDLEVGDYTIALQSGWTLERLDGAAYVPVEAELTSANPVAFSITADQVSSVVFVFLTDGQIVPVGNGTLAVSISVEETGDTDTDQGVFFDCDLPPVGAVGQAKPSGAAGGLTVLNWAGYQGAVSYTFDDANSSQINNYSTLNGLGVPFTFYLVTGWSGASNPIWNQAVLDGHELGNHTQTHSSTATAADIDAATLFIENNFGVHPTTFATPNGSSSYLSFIAERFFIGRGVSNTVIRPNDTTDPFNIPCYIPPTGASAATLNTVVDSARSAGAWQVMLVHGFTGGSDGAYQPIPLESFTSNVEHTKALADMWIDTVDNVGAYWVGQKTFAAASRTTGPAADNWTWQLPANFPTGKCLRVTVTGGTVSQNGQVVGWDNHGYYQISLDEGSLTVTP